MFDAVIFDWDGVLVDSHIIIVTAYQQTLREANIDISKEYIERHIGMGTEEIFRDILRETSQLVDDALVKRLAETKNQKLANLNGQVQFFPNAIDLLEALKDKVKVGLATMNIKNIVDSLVNTMGVEKYFQTIITADIVKQPKPNAEIFLKCAQQLNLSPEKCIVVEDSLFGVKAAKTAGMYCIAVTTGKYTKKELQQEKPDKIVTNLKQVKNYLLNILNSAVA
jgi:HAD superfamily hydrolase (TIGR01509 family)